MAKLQPRLDPTTNQPEVLPKRRVHQEKPSCFTDNCAIHAPSNHLLKNSLQGWNDQLMMLIRKCDCDIWHPDHDSYNYIKRVHQRFLAKEKLDKSAGRIEHILRMESINQENIIQKKLRMADGHICCAKRCCQKQASTGRAKNPLRKG